MSSLFFYNFFYRGSIDNIIGSFDELLHFVDCICEDKEPCVTGEDGMKALEVGLGVLKSVEISSSVEIGC